MADDWATPRWLIELMFPDGNYFNPCPLNGTGGLDSVWPQDRPVYINPPFSDPLPWVRRAAEHAGPVVMLLPVDPTTKWWTYERLFKVILIGSRLHFNEMTTYARQTCCIWRKVAPARASAANEQEQRP
jgi:hypothetical protein